MTLPFLLLGLYLGLLVVALSLCSWAGHSAPAPEEARRVTDAVERAGLSHLNSPARLAGGAVLLLSVVSGSVAVALKLPTIWFLLVPLSAPPLVGAALFYCTRKALRTSGQLAGLTTSDQRITLTSRTGLGAVLCCEATIGLVVLGAYSLCVTKMPADQARFLIYLTGSSIGLAAVVFARATTSAHMATARAVPPAQVPHPASLAVLVTSTFHAPLLRLLGLAVLSTFGHCALLSMDPIIAEDPGSVWLYPHLLKLLGLLGLLFAGFVVRSSEDESGGEGWLRGAAVYLVLMVAGAWSLSSELPQGWSRTVPAGLSFLYVALGLSLWSAGRDTADRTRSSFDHAFGKLPASLLFAGLMIVLALSTTLSPPQGVKSSPLPSTALMSLLLSGTLAAAPVGFFWILARSLTSGGRQTADLAYVGQNHQAQVRTSPSPRLLLALPLLSLVIALSALSEGLIFKGEINGLRLALLGLGASAGALTVAALGGQLQRSCSKQADNIARSIDHHLSSTQNATSLNFESAVVACQEAIARWDISWLLLCMIPLAAALSTRTFVALPLFQSLALGLGMGAALLGVGLELLFQSDERPSLRALAHLSFVACLVQAMWLLAAGSIVAGGSS